jgi:hypothetical protein
MNSDVFFYLCERCACFIAGFLAEVSPLNNRSTCNGISRGTVIKLNHRLLLVEQRNVKLRAVAGHGDVRAFEPYFVYHFH